ncbi:MAG: 16S rRNA (uracil(1498)-N(3))-methyltransferase [Ruminococcus sp.]|nr:16S rRNA (uracil(1498)-N(3))-methyltransferase [Ruminococcus sp.]
MPKFFINEPPQGEAVITGEDARHIGYSLRMRVGEIITLCADGTDYICEINSITPAEVRCSVLDHKPSEGEPSIKLTLYQAIPKGDKMETIIQKSVELGVTRIVPMLSARCVSRPDGASAVKKRERWQKIAQAAAKQCGRGLIPEVAQIHSFEEALRFAAALDRGFFFYEHAERKLEARYLFGAGEIGIVIGSEGGFEEREADAALRAGLYVTSLGPRILRCETAPIVAETAIMLLTGNL